MTTLQKTPALGGRGILLVMPLLLFPFLTLLFWAAGGGQNNPSPDETKSGGLNTQLPDAKLKNEDGTNKLSFYLQANRDSAKKAEEKGRDPFWNNMAFDSSRSALEENTGYRRLGGDSDPLPPSGTGWNGLDNNEAKVYQKMSKLNRILAGAQQTPQPQGAADNSRSGSPLTESGNRRLDVLSQAINGSTGSDPELEQLNTMLDKIAAIQHPDTNPGSGTGDNGSADRSSLRVRQPKSTPVPTIASQVGKDKKTAANKTGATFYSESYLSGDTANNEGLNTFSALVPRAQIIVNGSTIQLQLLQDVEVGGTAISKGNYLSGEASISGERLLIKIKSIRVGNNVYPVSLEVYDMDGLPGIYTPGSSTGDVVKQSSERVSNGFGLSSLDPSIGAQAAATGIEAAKSFINKKAKLIKVTIPAGYRILLKDSGTN